MENSNQQNTDFRKSALLAAKTETAGPSEETPSTEGGRASLFTRELLSTSNQNNTEIHPSSPEPLDNNGGFEFNNPFGNSDNATDTFSKLVVPLSTDSSGLGSTETPGTLPFGGRRFSVSAESMDPTSNETYEKKVIPKTEEQKARIAKSLQSNFLFRSLDEDSYNDVVDAMEEKHVEPGTDVIVQGGVGDYFYIIEKGKFEIYKSNINPDGSLSEPKLVGTAEDGGSFGEIALMYNAPRAATVTSTTDSTLWALDRVTFRRLLMERTSRKRKLYEKFLEEVPILSKLEPYELQKIADSLEPVTFEDGDVVIKQGDVGDCFYLIEDGKAKVFKHKTTDDTNPENTEHHHEHGEEQVGELTKGDYFGELALLSNDKRKATIMASGKLKCVRMSKESFDRLFGPLIKTFRRQSVRYT
ncbi:hypothetical protein BB559_003200 [Furculomyces boomerangus]|uniref:cAMP-dependent protein kinase regulatory subunit n=2 Tax=Harpellales TaxID=61421 RepID=A0A2T9YMZ8_9FUNG|nr:hypothetical protein BB559_003200 [Furculomyces boomerangus]PVZ99028.1 hypothetical protein BB558_004962 [Smittium angustum]